jgi:hypothetical protein
MSNLSSTARSADARACAPVSERAMRRTWQYLRLRGDFDSAPPAIRRLIARLTRALRTRGE